MQSGSLETEATIALMGATGTGKSSFINLLTRDDGIRVGHDLGSATLDVDTSIYISEEAGIRVTLVDTPGFDDSREGVSDTDILGKIVNFLQGDGGRKLNGIIYLHRISDPRFSGMAKKNLKVFRELCGDDRLEHVRIVTTFWNVASAKEGEDHEAALAAGVFKPFLEAGAKLVRHDNGLESAKNIISDLTRQAPVTMKIQEELDAGMVLGDTSAGAVIVEEMKELQKKHAQEMEELTKELEEATNENDEDLRAELDAERKKLAEKIARVEEDRERLTTMQAGLETLSHQSANIIDRGSAEHDGLVGEERRERPQTPDSRRIPHHEPHNTLEEGSAPRSVQERMERIIAMRAKDVADLKEVLERIGESNDALRREREELEQRIARSDTETEELKKVLSQLSQDRNSRETRDEVVKAAVARALEEERRKSYADCAMKLAEHIPLVPTIISKPVLGVMGFGLDVMRSHFQQ